MEITRTLDSIIDVEAKAFAIYTVENRAIPNIVDGLKPVQRFVLQRALSLARGDKSKFHKLASVAGGVADLGYHHGEASAADAGALMANDWNNNLNLLDGQGNFGSRLVQEAAAARYVYCRVSDNYRKLFKDLEIAPKHPDPEHIPPKFFLPVIPTVLINGVVGIATGYATTILPHSVESVIECTKLALDGELNKEPLIQYPKFNGKIEPVEDGGFNLIGTYKWLDHRTLLITEIPYKWDRAKYIEKVLDPLEADGMMTYTDECSKDGFGFKIKFKPVDKIIDKLKSDQFILDTFKLSEKVSQNLVVVDETGKVNNSFKTSSELIKHFVKIRLTYVEKRIEYKISDLQQKHALAYAKAKFIKRTIDDDIDLTGKTRSQLIKHIEDFDDAFKGFGEDLVAMSIYHLTNDEYKKLIQQVKSISDELKYWKSTTPVIEYRKDLDSIEL